jgi:sulfite exporter TauE/SafE
MEWGIIFIAGVVGSLHCLGMCSPLVLTYALNLPVSARDPAISSPTMPNVVAPHLRYHAGRIFVYSLLGALSAIVGTALGRVAAFTGIQAGGLLIGGGFMLLFGLGMVGVRLFGARSLYEQPPFWNRLKGWIEGLLGTGRPWAQVRLGMLNGLVPCGLVYGMLARAAAAPDPVQGAAVMLTFGAGTAPALIGIGALSLQVSRRWRERGDRLAAVLVLLLAVLLLLRGAARNAWIAHFTALGVMFW